jgi:putative membrane protein
MTQRMSHLMRAFGLAAWAAFLAWLWASGEMTRYLGPRTYWVVPFGAIALGAVACGYLLAVPRMPNPFRKRSAPKELLGLAILVLPMIAAVLVPSPNLGALAASRKQTGGVGIAGAVAAPAAQPEAPISFIDFYFAEKSEKYAAAKGMAEGAEVKLLGFVTRGSEAPPGTFELTRFYISCCAADAIPYSAPVRPRQAHDWTDDTWLEVSGRLARPEGHWVVVAESIIPRREPRDPYLY